jgi:hypothetical protein
MATKTPQPRSSNPRNPPARYRLLSTRAPIVRARMLRGRGFSQGEVRRSQPRQNPRGRFVAHGARLFMGWFLEVLTEIGVANPDARRCSHQPATGAVDVKVNAAHSARHVLAVHRHPAPERVAEVTAEVRGNLRVPGPRSFGMVRPATTVPSVVSLLAWTKWSTRRSGSNTRGGGAAPRAPSGPAWSGCGWNKQLRDPVSSPPTAVGAPAPRRHERTRWHPAPPCRTGCGRRPPRTRWPTDRHGWRWLCGCG